MASAAVIDHHHLHAVQKGRSFQDFQAFEARFDEILLVVSRHDHGEAGARLLPIGLSRIRRTSRSWTQPTSLTETLTGLAGFDLCALLGHPATNSTRVLHGKSACGVQNAVPQALIRALIYQHVSGPVTV